jgi:spore maturation protein CgeB
MSSNDNRLRKVLYAGDLDPYGTSYSRLVAMRPLVEQVVEFDAKPFLQEIASAPRWSRDLRSLQVSRAINRELTRLCLEHRPDVLWLDTGEWIARSTLKQLREAGIFLARHTTDALYPSKPIRLKIRRHLLRRAMNDFDLVFTSNERDHALLSLKYGNKFQLTDLGYDHRRFNTDPLPEELRSEWTNDIVFVGHHEPRTEAAVLALIDAGLNIQVYGHGPWFRSRNQSRLGNHLKPRLNNKDYEASLKFAKIGLCCVSEWNYNQTAARSFEIPASGCFLLAMRTDRHQEFYREGVEAEFFSDHAELIRKAKHYLENDDQRAQIARAGHQRAVTSGYSWDAIMKRDFEKFQTAYEMWKQR